MVTGWIWIWIWIWTERTREPLCPPPPPTWTSSVDTRPTPPLPLGKPPTMAIGGRDDPGAGMVLVGCWCVGGCAYMRGRLLVIPCLE